MSVSVASNARVDNEYGNSSVKLTLNLATKLLLNIVVFHLNRFDHQISYLLSISTFLFKSYQTQ